MWGKINCNDIVILPTFLCYSYYGLTLKQNLVYLCILLWLSIMNYLVLWCRNHLYHFVCSALWWPVGVVKLWHKHFNHIKGNRNLVLMHSGIVNEYQLLCDAHTLLEPHRGTAGLKKTYFTRDHLFPLFFICVCHS